MSTTELEYLGAGQAMSFREDRALTSPTGLQDTVKPFLPASSVLRWPSRLMGSSSIAFESIATNDLAGSENHHGEGRASQKMQRVLLDIRDTSLRVELG